MDNQITVKSILIIIITIALGVGCFLGLSVIKRKNKSFKILHRRYLLQLVQLFIIAFCIGRIVALLNPEINVNSILLTGSALIVAIVGFAAQTAISDIICGFLISVNKPFEIGDRIIIEGMQAGIVEDITLRHIVVGIYDDLKIIVPNSQLNTKTLINTSYHNDERRGIHLKFAVSYDTDVQKAIDIIRDCVVESPYTLGVVRNGVLEDSGPVYFLEFADSALMLETTIWVTKNTSSYVATTDINIRVNKAFQANNIEIPYNYLNVVDVSKREDQKGASDKRRGSTAPAKRYFRTNNIILSHTENDIGSAMKLTSQFAARQNLDSKEIHRLDHLTEESILFIQDVMGNTKIKFWIEGSGLKYKVHLGFRAAVGSKEYKRLIDLSSSGKNEAISTIPGRVFEAMRLGLESIISGNSSQYEWKLDKSRFSQKELNESILAATAGEITVHILKDQVEFIVSN